MIKIHDPVLVTTEAGLTFGVVITKTTTETSKGETTQYSVRMFQHAAQFPLTTSECDVHELPKRNGYGFYGVHAVVESHPGFAWAHAESERLNAPELPLAVEPAESSEGGAT